MVGVATRLYLFLVSALDGSDWSDLLPLPIQKWATWPQGQFWSSEKERNLWPCRESNPILPSTSLRPVV